MNLAEFIIRHENDDSAKLLLSASKWPEIDMPLAVNCIECRKKLKHKVPQWYAESGLIYGNRLCAEQCSSTATATLKAEIASSLTSGALLDLTGGLGIDSWHFSKRFDKVIYCEQDAKLADAARHNFALLGNDNIEVRRITVGHDNLDSLLEESKAQLVFADPARRSASGNKVFLIEDCTPDVLQLKDIIFRHCRHFVIKLSPMADISMCCKRLGKHCRQVNVIGSDSECKELLIVMDREWDADWETKVLEDGISFSFNTEEEKNASVSYISSIEEIMENGLLFEPSKAMLKSGAFKLPCSRFSLKKLAPFTHLYSGKSAEGFPSKTYRIIEAQPLDKEGIRKVSKLYPHSEITARNLKMDTDSLRKKMKLQSGNDAHIFGLGCGELGNWLFVCKREA